VAHRDAGRRHGGDATGSQAGLGCHGGLYASAYNGLGQRVAKTDSTGQYALVSDGAAPAAPVLADGLTVYTPGLSSRKNGASAFRHGDLLGSLRFETDANQNVVANRLYSGFGAAVSSSGDPWTPLGWVGDGESQTDADTGLVLMGHRVYDSRLGRFLSQDPAGDGDNWYAYADNDPVDETDPDGLMSAPTGAGMWGINGGTQSDGDWAMGNVEGDLASARNTWAEVLHLFLYRATDHHDGQGYQVDGEWPLWSPGGGMIAGRNKGGPHIDFPRKSAAYDAAKHAGQGEPMYHPHTKSNPAIPPHNKTFRVSGQGDPLYAFTRGRNCPIGLVWH